MVEKNFEYEDLVWAKMRGYPLWPSKIDKPPQNKPIKKGHHYIFFFGTMNYAWVLDENIEPHSEERLKSVPKKISATMQQAIDEIVRLAAVKGPKKSSVPIKVELDDNKTESSKKTSLTPSSSEKKAGKVAKKVLLPKKEKSAKVLKKTTKRRQSDTEPDSSTSKSRKVEDDYSALLANVPPTMGYSRVAVIHPYDEEPTQPHMAGAGILTRDDYIERPLTPSLDIGKVSSTLKNKNVVATKKKIGFLGLGMMGRGIVKNLLNSGHDVTVWNRTPEKCIPFRNAGANTGMTPADVVAKCDIIFCCFSDPGVTKTVMHEKYGVLKGFEGCVAGTKGYVEMTSIDPATSSELAEAISHAGGRYLEAPISGCRQLAEDGSLLILGAGDRELFNECESCFFAISKNAYYLSCVVGSGSKMNLIMSMFLGATYAALAESMALIQRCKLSPGNFLEILDLGPLSCPLLIEKGQAMLDSNFSTNTALKHQQKDLNLALHLGNESDQPMVVTAAANELYKHAKLLRYGDHDVSAVLMGAKY